MLRKRFLGVCTLSGACLFGATVVSDAAAQPKAEVIDLDEGDDEEKSDGSPDAVDIDLDEEGEGEGGGAAAGPVAAGQMTEEAAVAKKLFDQERWSQAALALYRVVAGETGDDPGNRQLAEYYLAISLYRLRFYQASYAIFSLIAENKSHLKFKETLLWLSKLATQLPEPADIVERVGKYSSDQLNRFNNPQQRDLYWQLNYLLGRYKYRNRQFREAIKLFEQVDAESEHFVQALFFKGISYVQLRKSVPAIESFQSIVDAIDDGVSGVEDEARMKDLAYLSMARTYYSASIKLDAETNAPSVDEAKLSAAVKFWNRIGEGSEYWLDSLFEQSWAYFMAGDYPRALGSIHTIQSPYFPNAFYPEADIVKAVVYFTNCNYEAATTVVARFNKHYVPIKTGLEGVMKKFKGENKEEPFFKFLLEVREGTADLDPKIKGIVELSLSDRQLLRNIEYVKVLDEELGRYKQAPSNFKSSPLGKTINDALKFARDMAVRSAGELAMGRYQRAVDELNEHLRNGEKILIDITAAQRNLLDEAVQKGQVTQAEAKIFGVVNPDEEHMLWPFDGEWWRDELGFYRQVVESACGR